MFGRIYFIFDHYQSPHHFSPLPLTVEERVYPTSLYFYTLFAALPSCKHITVHPLKRSENMWAASANGKFELLQVNQATTVMLHTANHF
jgi:hypothetical protein